MSLVRTESLFLTSLHSERQAKFAHGTFTNVVRSLLLPPSEDGVLPSDVAEEWLKWWDRCDDVRYWFLRETACVSSAHTHQSPDVLRLRRQQVAPFHLLSLRRLSRSAASSRPAHPQRHFHPRVPLDYADCLVRAQRVVLCDSDDQGSTCRVVEEAQGGGRAA